MFHVLGALAEFERNLIRERILAGLAAARTRGRPIGRPRKLRPSQVSTLKSLIQKDGLAVSQAGRRLGISRATAFRALARESEMSCKHLVANKKSSFNLEKICFQD
jgi:DNA invertase Pin-like site-specific DNA recombinase